MNKTRTFRWYAAIAFALGCFVLAAPAKASTSFTNGDFSTSVTLGAGVSFCPDGTTCPTSNVTSWDSECRGGSGCGSGSTVLWVLNPDDNGSAFNNNIGLYSMAPPPVDSNVIADDGDPAYSVSFWQPITGLVVGQEYAITFYQAAAQQDGLSGATTEDWEVTLGSETVDSAVMDNASKGFVDWEEQTLYFTAYSTSETLTFLAYGTPAGEPPISLLAGVTMQQVPEPAAAGVVVAALLGLSVVYRRKRATERSARASRVAGL